MNPRNTINIVGAACRLPGAHDEHSFWDLLVDGGTSVGPLPEGRWAAEAFYHPNPRAPGFAYSFSGGYLDAPYDFDINVFGLSPREAAQIDPQQRLLAEVVWEALEDARIAPSDLAGREVGVYVGVSALDHANMFGGDPGAMESHFMSGNTLSVVANRMSYLFDLRGPSLAVDTACSSSLVAVDRAVADIVSGRIDTAIVGGVNLLLSPASFIGFSRASMLSPTGACRPFSAHGDGYVRSEGAVAFILRRHDVAASGAARAFIVGTAVNSDGRTSGIALPRLSGQVSLLERAYRDAGVDPDSLAFIEAHGTGTTVGDPIEATAIGRVLGAQRSRPLPIGSVKSNIGHLEPASGVAGMMKALLALEHRHLPATLHLAERNPAIDFARLNLSPVAEGLALPRHDPLICGVSSFGFGGTNAHVIMAGAPRPPLAPALSDDRPPQILVISAACQDALRTLAGRHAAILRGGVPPERLADAVQTGRQRMTRRLALPIGGAEAMAEALEAFAEGRKSPALAMGSVPARTGRTCFVFNGNGAQWAGMGRQAYSVNAEFAQAFDRIDRCFTSLGAGSPATMLFDEALDERLSYAACAQPLLFAIQAALVSAFAAQGLKPDMVIGHSVGEIAAAHCAGIIDLEQAARLLIARAESQEAVRGAGAMAVLAADRAAVAALLGEVEAGPIGIAADNGPGSVTISGARAAVDEALQRARSGRIAGRRLDIDYPYHSVLLEEIRPGFMGRVGTVGAHPARLLMISTVTGQPIESDLPDARYWWRNVREEVLFGTAVRSAIDLGCSLFLEIGPKPILQSALAAVIDAQGASAHVLPTLLGPEAGDAAPQVEFPVRHAFAAAVANGFEPPAPKRRRHWLDRSVPLPAYPWQRRTYRHVATGAAVDIHGIVPRHPLIGAPLSEGSMEWQATIDVELVPYLADHVVDGEAIVPATALLEMALAVARTVHPDGAIAIEDFDILKPLVIPAGSQRAVSVRYGAHGRTVEIHARNRAGADDWTLCARGVIALASDHPVPGPVAGDGLETRDAAKLYHAAERTGIHYGPAFRLVERVRRADRTTMWIDLAPPPARTGAYTVRHLLHPASVDAALHAVFDLLDVTDGDRRAWLPIRFERLTLLRDSPTVVSASLRADRDDGQFKIVTLWLYDAEGQLVGHVERALLRPVMLAGDDQAPVLRQIRPLPAGLPEGGGLHEGLGERLARTTLPPVPEGRLLLRAHLRAALMATLRSMDGKTRARLGKGEMIAPDNLPRVRALLAELTGAGLLADECDRTVLVDRDDLPQPEAILTTFAEDNPAAATDLLLSAHAAASFADECTRRIPFAPRAPLLERHTLGGMMPAMVADHVTGLVRDAIGHAGAGPAHVVLVVDGVSALSARLAELARGGAMRLSIASLDPALLSRTAYLLPQAERCDFVDLADGAAGHADLLIGCAGAAGLTEAAERLLRPGGSILTVEVESDIVDLFQTGAPLSRRTRQDDGSSQPSFAAADESWAIRLERKATATDAAWCAQLTDRIAGVASASDKHLHVAGRGAQSLDSRLLGLRDWVLGQAAQGQGSTAPDPAWPDPAWPHPTWIVCAAPDAESNAALAAFGRVAINERPDKDLRLVEIDPSLAPRQAAAALASIMAAHGAERWFLIGADGVAVPRVGAPGVAAPPDSTRALFRPARRGALDRTLWRGESRPAPGAGDVEIEIAAAGLNFRDVMLGFGILGDDVVDDAGDGPVFGLECAGRISAIGEGVEGLCPGDTVMGFTRNSFASHIVVPAAAVSPVPSAMAPEAAAAIPVAFLTAWYAIEELIRLRPGERILIHGGAGGVGLAAIQIARAMGAEVIATASAPDKRSVASLFGAHHLCDSRSLDFAPYVRERFGGVDAVINSLAGDAMRASIGCLAPRGRFVELGKRDFVDNSPVGLRHFRRNISYFALDIDQIVAEEPDIARRGMAAIVAGFGDGRYLPLPCMVHEAVEIGSAFRLMQSSGHAGKIVIRPASPPREKAIGEDAVGSFRPGEGVHLVIGGTRGLGLETVLWLAARGAPVVVAASLSGAVGPDAEARIVAAREAGCDLRIERVDVSDGADVVALIERVAPLGPLRGVYHAAVALDDAMLGEIEPDALRRVLAAKADGAGNLDRATRGLPIEQFVLYSSASALVGNPGQGAYAAANGYLEGVARRRRAEGLPALAVQWGAIADVGLLADRGDTMENLARIAGVAAMSSAEALQWLDRLLGAGDALSDPVVLCSRLAPGGMAAALPLLGSPAFAALFDARGKGSGETRQTLADLIAGKSDPEALRLLTALVTEEVAHILRLSVSEVDPGSAIDALGMDSLMALELRMSLESKYRIELPVMAVGAMSNLRDVAQRILAVARPAAGESDAAPLSAEEARLLALHGMSQEQEAPRMDSGAAAHRSLGGQ